MSHSILHVVTNVSHYDDPDRPTGLWLSELAHAWEVFGQHDFAQAIVSPHGGVSPLEPRSLKFPNYDRVAKAWHGDPDRMALLQTTHSPDEIDAADYDAIFFTGGHAVMYDFPDSEGLQHITRQMWEQGGIVSSVCHGYCGLLNTRLSVGSSPVRTPLLPRRRPRRWPRHCRPSSPPAMMGRCRSATPPRCAPATRSPSPLRRAVSPLKSGHGSSSR